MSGIGEASAIISVVELGFSLATALNTYVCSVCAAPDDVSSLSSEIEATLSHLRGLESLITKNEETKAWDKDGLELATRSITDCERIVTKLRRLLQKASRREKEDEQIAFVKSEIDLSKFERALWPRLKPELEVCKSELQRIKLNIILAHNSYMIGAVSTEAEKVKYREAIRGLNLAREWNARKIKRARDRRSKPPLSGPGPSPHVHIKSPMPMPMPSYSFMENEIDIELQEDFERFLEQEEEREEEVERQFVLAQVAKKREFEEEKKKEIEKKAIDEYVGKLKKAEAEAKKNRDELRRKLEERGGLTQPQIELIIDDVYPRSSDRTALLLQSSQTSDEQTALVASFNGNQNQDGSDSVRSMSRLSSFRKLLRPNSGNDETNSNNSAVNTLSSAWRDPATKTGFARLESWYISANTSGRGCRQMHAPLPQSWMLKALMEAETGNSKYSKKFPPVWEVLLSLSPQLVAQINNLLEERAARKPDYDWSILLIDLPQALENRRSVTIGPFKFYLEDKNEEVNDIYVVLKYEENLREKQGKSSGRQRSISPESALSENSITPRRPSASLMPERSRSISRRMSSISRARSTLRNSYDPEELYDRDEQRAPRRPSRRSSSRVYNDYTPPAATRDYGYYPGGQQTQEYFATPDDRRPGPPSYIRPIIEDERRVRREPAEGQWHDRYQYFVQNMPPPPTRYPSTGASSYPSYGNPFSTPPVHLDPEILRDRARDAYYYSDNEPYSEKNPITRQQHAQERRRFNRSPVRDPVRDYYDNDNYADGMVHERVLNSRRAMSIQPIRRTNSLGRERDEIEDSDSDEINSHERRKNINQDHRRLNTEKDAKRHVTPRRHSVARDLKATVGDERDEDEFLSSEKEIADRLVAKHTRPLAEAKIPENERMSNGNGGGEGLHMPTRLSDIVEVDESDTSSKEGGNKEGNSSDGW